jgi:hypothetical protein
MEKEKICNLLNLAEEVETLFKFVPPRQLRKTLFEVYSVYLQNLDHMDFKEIAMDMYLLNKFLEKAEEMD